MATVGQVLTAPEVGWKRYDDRDSNISYIGGAWTVEEFSGDYNSTLTYIPECTSVTVINDSKIRFNFTGTSIRFIHTKHSQRSTAISYKIDGVLVGTANMQNATTVRQVLGFEKTDLISGEHHVEIYTGDGIRFDLDAVDIDENGELLPYNPTPEEPEDPDLAILRVTMNDSSEREYPLTAAEINGFINWFNQHASTDATSFMFNKTVGSQTSKEYLAYDKIISFEVIPVA
ncbi:MAG: hypothetical protein K0R55_4536 [Sporomusa sp.]|jgi:hypothetical protein|nr:hypothetical protein [Sporomusa sp.]